MTKVSNFSHILLYILNWQFRLHHTGTNDGLENDLFVKVLNELMKILLSISPSKEIADRTRQRNKIFDLGGKQTHDKLPSGLASQSTEQRIDDQIRRSCVRFPPRSKIFSLSHAVSNFVARANA